MDLEREWINEVRTFINVADQLSFSKAAEILGVTSSAVSRTLGRMEDRLKTKLFFRTTRAVRLTEIGSAYLHKAREIISDIQNMEAEIETLHHDLSGIIRVTAPLMFGHAKVLPIALSFQEKYPEIKLHLDFTDRIADLLEERIDVAIRMTSAPPLSFVAKKLCSDERVLCASRKYISTYGAPKTPDELRFHFGVLFCKADAPVQWQLFRSKNKRSSQGYLPKARMHLSSIMSVYAAAKSGLGIADLPRYMVADDLKQGRLVPILADYTHSTRQIWAIYPGTRVIPKKVRVFLEMLKASLS